MKIFCASLAAAGLLSGSIYVQGQSAGGSAGGAAGGAGGAATGAAGAGQAGSAQIGGAAPGVGARGGIASPGTGGIQTRGGIASPGTGGVANQQGAIAAGGPTAAAAPGAAQQPVTFNALPAQVQTSLRTQLGATVPTSITQQMTPNGAVYTVMTTQNGQPIQLQVAPNGQVIGINRNPAALAGTTGPTGLGTAPGTLGAGNAAVNPTTQSGLGNVGAGMPLSTLPAQVQAGIRSQLGNAQVQTISQDQLADGSVFRVTAVQNGVPVEYQFAANGTLLGRNQLAAGTATSAFVPGVVGTLPGTQVVLDDVPENIQNAIRDELGETQASQIRVQETPTGNIYWVAYTQDGRPMRMRVNEDGTVRTGVVGGNATAEAQRNEPARITLEELPEEVHATLEAEAPLADIVSIQREQRPTGEVYRISFHQSDRFTVMTIDAQGEIIRDSRNVPMIAVGETQQRPFGEDASAYRYERLPAAVKTAVKAYAAEGDIRTINLTRYRNDTVFSVVFMRDARRDRMLVSKAGDVLKIEEDVSPALAPAVTGDVELAIGDLPPAVRDTIRRQTDQVMVDEIKMDTLGEQTVYRVSYRTNNTPVDLFVGTDGAIVLPIGNLEGAGSSLPAPIPVEEESPVRTIDVAGTRDSKPEAAGLPARRETGEENEPPSEAPIKEPSSVNLKDVPLEVQKAAKKLAGNAVIKSIAPKLEAGKVVYAVTYKQAGSERTVDITKEGQLQQEAE